jgi:hypothetical protein
MARASLSKRDRMKPTERRRMDNVFILMLGEVDLGGL